MEHLPEAGELRRGLGIAEGEFAAVFASEPLSSDYGGEAEAGRQWGFSERSVFRALRESFEKAAEATGRRVRLMVKLHPREGGEGYGELLATRSPLVSCCLMRSGDALEIIRACDLVCGMSSMMLIEAAMAQAPVLSILLNLKRESPFVLDRQGIVPSARSQSEAEKRVLMALKGEDLSCPGLEVTQQPVQAIIEAMEAMLNEETGD